MELSSLYRTVAFDCPVLPAPDGDSASWSVLPRRLDWGPELNSRHQLANHEGWVGMRAA